MAATIANLAVSLTAKSDGFTKGMYKARKETQSLVNSIGSATRSIGQFAVAAVGLGSIGGIIAKLNDSLMQMADTSRTARSLGETSEGFTKLAYAARKSGIDQAQFTETLRAMTRNLGLAKQGTGEAVGTLNALRLNLGQLVSAGPAEAFSQIAEAISKLPTAADRAAAAAKLFGDAGVKLLPVLSGGSKGIAKLASEAEKLGAVLSDESALRAENYAAAIERMKAAWSGAWMNGIQETAVSMQALALAAESVNKTIALSDNDFVSLWTDVINRPFSTIADAALATLANLTGGLDMIEIETPAYQSVNALADSMENAKSSAQGLADTIIPALTAQEQLANRLAVTVDELGRFQSMAAQAFESTRTPTEQFQTDLKDLTRLYAMGLINLDTLNRASSAKLDQLFPKPNASGLPTLSDIKSPSYSPTGNTPLTSNYLTRSPGTGSDKQLVDIGRAQLGVLKTTQQAIRELVRQQESKTQEVDL